jgi:hypothetical protein
LFNLARKRLLADRVPFTPTPPLQSGFNIARRTTNIPANPTPDSLVAPGFGNSTTGAARTESSTRCRTGQQLQSAQNNDRRTTRQSGGLALPPKQVLPWQRVENTVRAPWQYDQL